MESSLQTSNKLLIVKDLTRHYSKVSRGVTDITFDIESGEKVALLGLNGAGKSTTFKLLTGLLAQEKGSIELAGYNLKKDISKARRAMGYLSEDIPLCNELSVMEHLNFQVSHFGADLKKLDELIELCELKEVLKKPIGNLSRGFRQRVALAGTLVHNPQMLLLDEPTSGLDPKQVDQFRKLIKQVSATTSLLISTHILSEVEQLCDRCLILHEGKLVKDVQLPIQGDNVYEVECKGVEIEQCEEWLPIEPESSDSTRVYQAELGQVEPDEILKNLMSRGVKVVRFAPVVKNLETLFLEITSGKVL